MTDNYRSYIQWSRSPRRSPRLHDWLTPEYGTDRVSSNVGIEFPLYTALDSRRAQVSRQPYFKKFTFADLHFTDVLMKKYFYISCDKKKLTF